MPPSTAVNHPSASLAELLSEIAACRLCAGILPHGPRPVVHASATARLLIVSQAPGIRVHETGISFNDRSGDRLRDWLGLDRAAFYDKSQVAIMGMGFCYPGTDAKGGDLPPTPLCAPHWHPQLLPMMPAIRLTLLVGSYAVRRYLGLGRAAAMTPVLRHWRDFLPRYIVMPHPSWRNAAWLSANPWFETELLPGLRRRVRSILDEDA